MFCSCPSSTGRSPERLLKDMSLQRRRKQRREISTMFNFYVHEITDLSRYNSHALYASKTPKFSRQWSKEVVTTQISGHKHDIIPIKLLCNGQKASVTILIQSRTYRIRRCSRSPTETGIGPEKLFSERSLKT